MDNREYGAHDRVKRIMQEWDSKAAPATAEDVAEKLETVEVRLNRAETFEKLVALQKKLEAMEAKFEAEYIEAEKEVEQDDPRALKALADIQEQFKSLL